MDNFIQEAVAEVENPEPKEEPQDSVVTKETQETQEPEQTQEAQPDAAGSTPIQQPTPTNQEPTSSDKQLPQKTPQPRLFKFKVDGEDLEIPEDKLQENVQLAIKSRRALSEADQVKKSATELYKMLSEKPVDAILHGFEKRGLDKEQSWNELVKMSEAVLERQLKLLEMSEPERQLMTAQAKLQEQERRLKEFEAKQTAEKFESEKQMYFERVSKEIREAIKESGLEDSDENRREVARRIVLGDGDDYEISPQDAAKQLKEEVGKYLDSRVGSLSPDEVLQKYPDFAKKLSEALVKQVKDSRVGKAPPKSAESKREEPRGPIVIPAHKF